jgi:two-component system response regulator NreC
MKTIRSIIVEDHELTREGIRFVLSGLPSVEVVGMASTPAEAFHLIRRYTPDVAMVDLGLPAMETGLGVIEDIRAKFPWVKILTLTAHEEASAVKRALAAGADGYILKSAPISEFSAAILAVAEGKKYLSPDVSANVINGYLHQETPKESLHTLLSRREREVLGLVSEGKSNKEIGEILFISPRTVEKHKESLKRKLQCGSCIELATYSLRHGIIG